MKLFFRIPILCLFVLLSLFPPITVVHAGEPVVHAVLFYSPTCPHCHKVITEDLPPLIDKYGEQLFIMAINTHTEQGQSIYQAAIKHFQLPSELRGVPTLIVGETVLVGSIKVSQQFPGIIEEKLAEGGIDWPDIPGLHDLIEAENIVDVDEENVKEDDVEQISDTRNEHIVSSTKIREKNIEKAKDHLGEDNTYLSNEIRESIVTTESMTLQERFMRDKTGNTISVFVLFGMAFSVVWTVTTILGSNQASKQWPNWAIPMLLLIGLAAAIYMGYVEITQTEAVCGPVGDCNTVQQSPYARLFGLLPVGVLGLLGYVALMIAWAIQYYGPAGWRKPAAWAVWGMALFGTLFSIYLTFLEPFVIGATCAWCLTSAVVMTLLLWAATTPVMQIWKARAHTKRYFQYS